MKPGYWWSLVVTVGNRPVHKNYQSIGIIIYPRIPVFPKVGRPDQKQLINALKWEDIVILTTKKPPRWGLMSAAGLERATNGLKEYWPLGTSPDQEPA